MGDPRPPLARRIVVTGLPGSGKSTFALALGARTGVPVIHLDLEFWNPGWVAPSEPEWRERQRRVLGGGAAWIAEGNYHDTLDLRLALADSVVVLDTPWWRCSGRALLRGLRMPDQLPDGCDYTRWQRLRDEWQLAGRIWRTRRSEPATERRVIARHGDHATVHVLRSPAAATELLDRLAAPSPTPATDEHGESGPSPLRRSRDVTTRGATMQITGVLAQATVDDLAAAEEWYGRLFDRAPDHRPMDGLLEWHLGDGRGVQVWREPARAGRSTLVLVVDDIDAHAARLHDVGLTDAEVEDATSSRILVVEDPDGNRIVLTGA